MKTDRRALVLALAGGAAVISAPALARSRRPLLTFEPDVVTLSGRLERAGFPGPPGYGETPDVDAREEAFILVCDRVFDVRGGRDGGPNTATVQGVRRVQVVSQPALRALIGKRVTVRGSLFAAITAHHHTAVLITASSVNG